MPPRYGALGVGHGPCGPDRPAREVLDGGIDGKPLTDDHTAAAGHALHRALAALSAGA